MKQLTVRVCPKCGSPNLQEAASSVGGWLVPTTYYCQEDGCGYSGPVYVEVDAEEIASIVARWTGIPVSRLMEGETEKLIHMEERLHARVIGQDQAVKVVSNAVRRARAGLQEQS